MVVCGIMILLVWCGVGNEYLDVNGCQLMVGCAVVQKECVDVYIIQLMCGDYCVLCILSCLLCCYYDCQNVCMLLCLEGRRGIYYGCSQSIGYCIIP